MSCSHSVWPWVSSANGVASFALSFVSLFPQIIETYRDKTVAGLSPLFLLAWVCGDITSLLGAVLTNQLTFQIVLAFYFLLNDLFVCGQYYYYGILHGNQLATAGHESKISYQEGTQNNDDHHHHHHSPTQRSSSPGLWQRFLSTFFLIGVSNALPLVYQEPGNAPPSAPLPSPESPLGTTLSWVGASFYVGARIPQLIKNYRRKSTDGISPLLFGTTLLCNLTYNFSILSSCDFIDSSDKSAFLWNAAPFIAGSAGTVAFDVLYFYQHYVLYSDDLHYREALTNHHEDDERAPLLE
ncbi:hypothetical protein ZYGR_0A02810 [Zygosaccharomyces rouxii]|uniref:ZYRO0A06358p n=2 Tax=Zygosaccharomyces rouxii TaxID=4956 RepID=C5DPV3_ZYGRC|nr:uncharacterized protein ZYRO0A06358g [Zygosaccharomyces rouxii]KAH9198765.1 PQ loop repeat-domain-containing protein [Zygosaccharomyces rouxii]GAV46687.1 hypothetical protein ZYGR_0A02810 [Zygosaccharomyces rouxii]CAR25714.1 ZYRO0A06358p [Zygosaccharomyces rouxii]